MDEENQLEGFSAWPPEGTIDEDVEAESQWGLFQASVSDLAPQLLDPVRPFPWPTGAAALPPQYEDVTATALPLYGEIMGSIERAPVLIEHLSLKWAPDLVSYLACWMEVSPYFNASQLRLVRRAVGRARALLLREMCFVPDFGEPVCLGGLVRPYVPRAAWIRDFEAGLDHLVPHSWCLPLYCRRDFRRAVLAEYRGEFLMVVRRSCHVVA